MADKVTRILLEFIALDKATSTLKAMMDGLQGWADKMNGVGAETALSSEQLEAAQVRLLGAADAEQAALEGQAAALGRLEAAQASVVEAQQAAVNAQLEAQQAAMEASAAVGDEAVAMEAYAKTAAASAAAAADAVKLSVDAQVAAYDKLMAADSLVEERSAQVAAAQVAAGNDAEAAAAGGLGKLGPVMLAAGAAATYLTVKSVKLAADFQTAMTKLVTSAGESQSAMAMVGAGVLKISDETGIAAGELAKALYFVDSAGYHAADSLKILEAAAKGARDEQANTADVTNALTTVMVNYGLSADKATMIMNQMITAVSMGKTNLQDFATALSRVLPVAAANGVSFAEVSAALSMMTAKGMTAQNAADNLSNAMRNMVKPNGQAIIEMEQLGLSATAVEQSLGKNGLVGTFEMLHNAVISHMGPSGLVITSAFNQSKTAAAKAKEMFDSMPASMQKLASELENGTIGAHNWTLAIRQLDPVQQKMMQQFATMFTNSQSFNKLLTSNSTPAAQAYTGAMQQMMGGAAGLNTMLMLTSGQGMDQFAANAQKIAGVSKTANGEVLGWSDVQGTFNQKMAEAKQTLTNTGIAIGTVLLPYVTKLIDAVMKILNPLAQWITAHQKLIGTILAIMGPLLGIVGIFITVSKVIGMAKAAVLAFRTVMLLIEETDPIVLALTAVIVAVILAIKYWKQIKEAIMDAWGWIKAHVHEVAAALTLLLGPFGAFLAIALEIVTHWKTVKQWFSDFWEWLKKTPKEVADFLERVWNDVAGFFERIWNDVAGFFKRIWGDVAGFFKRIWNDVATWFKGIFGDIAAPVKKEWDRIKSDLGAIWQELTTLWNDTGGKLVSLISRNWGSIENVASTIWGTITRYVSDAADFISQVWDAAVAKAKQAWDVYYTVIKAAWDLIVGLVKLQLNILKTIIKTAWDVIQGTFHVEWDLISGIVKAAWDVIYGITKAALDVIEGILNAAWEALKTVVKVAWDFITGLINTALDFIKDILKVFIDVVTGKWGQLWNDVRKTFTDVMDNISSFAGKILGDVVGFFEKAARDIGSGFIKGLKDLGNSAWNALGDLWNSIMRFFSDAVHWLWQAGKDLVQGLINGIENWASHLWDTLSNLAGGILGKIGKFLGLGSPSRITFQHGQYLVEGLVNGINASAAKAANAARNMALGVVAASSGTFGNVTLAGGGIGRSDALFAGAAGAGAGRPTVNVTNDLRGAQIAGPASINWITDQINKNFVQKVVPTAGITTRRTGG